MIFFLVALASACTETHYLIEGNQPVKMSKQCVQTTFRGTECDNFIAHEKLQTSGKCAAPLSGHICCQDVTALDFRLLGEQARTADCAKQICKYIEDMTAYDQMLTSGHVCVEISAESEPEPSNKISCSSEASVNVQRRSLILSQIQSQMAEDRCWELEDGFYVLEGHMETDLCFDTLEEAKTECQKRADCGAISSQNNVCGGKFRIAIGGPTFIDWQEYNSEETNLRSWRKKCDSNSITDTIMDNVSKKAAGFTAKMDTCFGIFPEGGKTWLFLIVASVASVCLIVPICCCMCKNGICETLELMECLCPCIGCDCCCSSLCSLLFGVEA